MLSPFTIYGCEYNIAFGFRSTRIDRHTFGHVRVDTVRVNALSLLCVNIFVYIYIYNM